MIETRKADNNDAKVMEDSRQWDDELRFKYAQLGQELEVKEAELVTDTALELVKDEQKTRGSDSDAGGQSAA